MTADEPPPDRPGPPGPPGAADPGRGEPEPEHRPDGLELAREQARSAAGSTPRARSRRRRPAGPVAGRLSGAHPDDRDPQLLDSTLARLVDQHGWALELRVRGVFARWREIVGNEVADHTTPESFVTGRLVVRTDSTAWATQLRLLGPAVVRRLNEELGDGTVTELDIQGPVGPSWKKGRRSTRDGRGPRDTYG